jgi:hypothetical protein
LGGRIDSGGGRTERAQTLLARGQEYGESRVVCGVHYPSDIVGGQLVATAVVARLHAEAEFNRDLDCARQELATELKPDEKLTPACEVRKTQLRHGGCAGDRTRLANGIPAPSQGPDL